MRGGGEPVFETDFPDGTDTIATLRTEMYGKERFEMELKSRLRLYTSSENRGEIGITVLATA
jgi:hypothetical protein